MNIICVKLVQRSHGSPGSHHILTLLLDPCKCTVLRRHTFKICIKRENLPE